MTALQEYKLTTSEAAQARLRLGLIRAARQKAKLAADATPTDRAIHPLRQALAGQIMQGTGAGPGRESAGHWVSIMLDGFLAEFADAKYDAVRKHLAQADPDDDGKAKDGGISDRQESALMAAVVECWLAVFDEYLAVAVPR